MGRGRASPTGVCLRRGNLHLPLELLCPFPGPAAARPAPRQARTNCADELLKSFLRALFPRSRSQRPPVATCQSWGLITCAGLGAAHSSPASPCEMLTSGRWAPRPPASSAEGTEGGDMIHKLTRDRQRLCCKKRRKLGKGKVSRSVSEQLCAASGHVVHPALDWTLRAAWKP